MEMNSLTDWERWVELFHDDPEAFERERLAAIEELIASQPADIQRRSRQLQWRIDAVRRRSPNNLSACIRISAMMIDAVYGPGGLLEVINDYGREHIRPRAGKKQAGVCLQLTGPAGRQPGSTS